MAAPEERRKRKRVALHWPVRFYRDPDSPSVETLTENLTSNGFYCVSKQSFQPGEQLKCVIVIPAGALGYSENPVRLQCRVKVVRIENQSGSFGLGCYIEDYELLIDPRKEPRRAMSAGPFE